MPIDCEDQELLEGFLAETTELLEKLDDDLIALEKASDDPELMNRIFRSIHTVKGASSFLGFDLLVRVTHKTEDVLNRLRHLRDLADRDRAAECDLASLGAEDPWPGLGRRDGSVRWAPDGECGPPQRSC